LASSRIFQAVFEHDFLGPNARVWRIDDRLAKQVPAEVARLATAILMYSFGGTRRDAGEKMNSSRLAWRKPN
jgi:hypothetical protein